MRYRAVEPVEGQENIHEGSEDEQEQDRDVAEFCGVRVLVHQEEARETEDHQGRGGFPRLHAVHHARGGQRGQGVGAHGGVGL